MDKWTKEEMSLLDEYFHLLKNTRKSKRISQSIIDNLTEYFSKYPKHLVLKALRIHIKVHPDKKESYTKGILRNLKSEEERSGESKEPSRYTEGNVGTKYRGASEKNYGARPKGTSERDARLAERLKGI